MSLTVVLAAPLAGHVSPSCLANHWLSVPSLVGNSRFSKELQCAMPTVCPPDSVTRSVASRLILARNLSSVVTFDVGAGSASNTAVCDAGDSESRRPRGTIYAGPPAMPTESRAARATMSAQETTVAPQALSRRARRSLMALNAAGRSVRLGPASCSLFSVAVESRRMEASQPCTKQSWKWRRMRAAARPTFCFTADARKSLTIDSALGHKSNDRPDASGGYLLAAAATSAAAAVAGALSSSNSNAADAATTAVCPAMLRSS
nr:unnamed protein product [Digitaria exilis]